MNFRFKIELYKSGRICNLYTIQIQNEPENEFEKFLNDPEIKSSEDFLPLLAHIENISNELGAREHYFKKKESKYLDNVEALPRGEIRLYCMRFGNAILILGSGGIKRTRTTQEDHKLSRSIDVLAYADKKIYERILSKEIQAIGNVLIGDLNFE